MVEDEHCPADAHLLALGRTVYEFQKLEWVAIWTVCFLIGDWPSEADRLMFGPIVAMMKEKIDEAGHLPDGDRALLRTWADSLGAMNTLRQDMFHWHPVPNPNEFVRRRPKTDLRIAIDTNRLDAARHRFEVARLEGEKVLYAVWPPLTHASIELNLPETDA